MNLNLIPGASPNASLAPAASPAPAASTVPQPPSADPQDEARRSLDLVERATAALPANPATAVKLLDDAATTLERIVDGPVVVCTIGDAPTLPPEQARWAANALSQHLDPTHSQAGGEVFINDFKSFVLPGLGRSIRDWYMLD